MTHSMTAIRPVRMLVPPVLGLCCAALLIGLPWPANVFILAGFGAGLTAVRRPELSLGGLLLVIPVQAAWEGQIGPVHLTLTKTVFSGLVLGWIVHLLLERRGPRITWLAMPYGAYVLVVLLSGVVASHRATWWIEVYHWVNGFTVYLIAVDCLRCGRLARAPILATALGVIGLSLYGFQQVIQHAGPPSFTVNGVTRAFATFGQPNPFAGYLDVTVPLLAALTGAWMFRPRESRGREFRAGWWVGIVSLAALLGVAVDGATQSRGGWLGMAIGVGVVIWLLGGLVRLGGTVVALVVLASVLASPIGASVGARLSEGSFAIDGSGEVTTQNFAVRERLAHWEAGVRMAVEHPWLGVGAGNFNAEFRDATQVWRFRIPRGHAHNAYIQAAAQTGLLGLTAYLVLVGSVGVRLCQRLRETKGTPMWPFVVGAVGVCLAFAVHNLVDYLHVHNLPAQLGVVIAMAEIPMLKRASQSHRPLPERDVVN